MVIKASKPLKLDHPGIAEACAKLVQAREIRQEMEKIEKEQKEIITVILEEFPDTKKFTLLDHTIAWRTTSTQKPAKFKKYLVDIGVDPEVIQDATEASKTEGEPWLLVERKKE